jgi:NADPH:quinone reductase-like Zn-dependent oxidoreductase
MKAIVRRRYGPPDVLRCEELEKPTAADDEVLIRVRAASVNPRDWHFMRGTPYFVRMMAGLRKPTDIRLGVDAAGEVEAVAEYACATEPALVMKPDSVTFDQGASVATAALTALQGLRKKGPIISGQKVLINGAAGGVGTFAVQIAKSLGADVTGVCSTRNVDMVRSIGADHVTDYAQEDFTKSGQVYDLILDCVGNHSLSACRRALNPEGTYVAVGGSSGRWMIGPLARTVTAPLLSRFVSQNFHVLLTRLSKEDLTFMSELMQARKVTPVIDRRYRLSDVPEAIRYLEQGHARGKVVINM